MTTGRINQVARDEPPPEPHAHNPKARASARTRTSTARPNDGTPGIRHLRPRTNHSPSRMRNHTPPDESLARTTRQILAGGAPKTPTLRTTAHRECPNHTTTQPRPHARALARARTRRRACHTPDTPCDSAQTALTQNTRAAHLATTRTKLEPNAHPPRRRSHPAHAIKRAAKQLTPRNGRHSGRNHRRPRPGAFTPRRQPVPSRRTCKHTQVPTLREDAQWETAPSSPARANRQAPPARISAPRPHPHSSTPESGTRAATRALPTCATSHYSDRRNGHRRTARARLASSWAMPIRCKPLRAAAKRKWTRTIEVVRLCNCTSSNALRTQPPQRPWPPHHACCTTRSRATVTRDSERRRYGVGPMRHRVSSSDLAEPQEPGAGRESPQIRVAGLALT